MRDYFVKVPNWYIRHNIKDDYGISRKFFIVYIFIGKYRSLGDHSWIVIDKIFDFYRIKDARAQKDILKEVIDVLDYMAAKKMIEVKTDIKKVKPKYGIEIRVNSSHFDPPNDFTRIYMSDMDYIKRAGDGINRENLLIVTLYMLSYLYREESGFSRSIENFAEDTGLSRNTIYKCIDILTSDQEDRRSLFIKGETQKFDREKKLPSTYYLRESDIGVKSKAGYTNETSQLLELPECEFEDFVYTDENLDEIFK